MEGLLELSAPTTLSTPIGDLALNAASGARYLVLPDQSTPGVAVRGPAQNLSQSDGARIPERYGAAYTIQYAVQLLYNHGYALGATLVAMLDDLAGALEAILNSDGTLTWTPLDGAATELTGVRQAAPPVPTGAFPKTVTFTVDSPLAFPVPA